MQRRHSLKTCCVCGQQFSRQDGHKNRYGQYLCQPCRTLGKVAVVTQTGRRGTLGQPSDDANPSQGVESARSAKSSQTTKRTRRSNPSHHTNDTKGGFQQFLIGLFLIVVVLIVFAFIYVLSK